MFYKQDGFEFHFYSRRKGMEHRACCMGRTNVSITDQYVVYVNDNYKSLTCWKMSCQVQRTAVQWLVGLVRLTGRASHISLKGLVTLL